MILVLTVLLIVFAGLSIALNSIVIYRCFMHHFKSFQAITTRLIITLHISCFLENICSIPYIYTGNNGLCAFMAFAHYYTGLINVLTIVYLTIAYYYYVIGDGKNIVTWIHSYGLLFACIFSLITLIPFITNSYGREDIWCTLSLSSGDSNDWSFIVFYLWVLVAIFFCSIVCSYIIIYTIRRSRNNNQLIGMTTKLFISIGAYIIISIFCYISRVLPRLVDLFLIGYKTPDIFSFFSGVPMYFAGILYCVCFYYNRETLKTYERNSSRSSNNTINNSQTTDNPLRATDLMDLVNNNSGVTTSPSLDTFAPLSSSISSTRDDNL